MSQTLQIPNELLKAAGAARLPSTPEEQIVYRTNSDNESIILICGGSVHYARKGDYGDWLVRADIDNSCRAYLARPTKIVDIEHEAVFDAVLNALPLRDIAEIDRRIKAKGGTRKRVELVDYVYITADYKIKKKAAKYTVVELVPLENPAKLKARALRLTWVFYGSRSSPKHEYAQQLVEMWRLEIPAARYMYVEGDRSAWLHLKLVVEAPSFNTPTTAVEPQLKQADSLEEALKELEAALSELGSQKAEVQTAENAGQTAENAGVQAGSQMAAGQPAAGENNDAEGQTPRGGMVEVKLLLFTLPSEYRRADVRIQVGEKTVTEVRKINGSLAPIKTLRTEFYDRLKAVAYRFHDVWALYSDVKPSELDELVRIASEIEDVAKAAGIDDAKAEIVVVPAYIPRDYLLSYLNRHIDEVRKRLAEAKSQRVRKELKQALERLIRELESLR